MAASHRACSWSMPMPTDDCWSSRAPATCAMHGATIRRWWFDSPLPRARAARANGSRPGRNRSLPVAAEHTTPFETPHGLCSAPPPSPLAPAAHSAALGRHRQCCRQRRRPPRADRLAARGPLRLDACGVPGGDLGGRVMDRSDRCGGALCRAHVRDHRVLPPLFFASHLPGVASGAVRIRCHRGRQRATRTAVVGRAPSPPSPPRRPAAGPALAA
ncbi:hypothetical protein G6F35_013342 [Rhizopus arrhizus]|nr:hypothetical protein G6F35_013342 [Rhizopus arrhizus]